MKPADQPEGCEDVSVRVAGEIRALLMDLEFLSVPESGGLVRDCFASGELQESHTFPKLWALVKYLESYRDRAAFHGIIFVRTRQALFHVADMLRRTQQLAFLDVIELIGGAAGPNDARKTQVAGAAGPGAPAPVLPPPATGAGGTEEAEGDRHGRGMTDGEVRQALRMFRKPGRKVLVATSAAEEGLDIPSCEFVVRYNAAGTGIQLLQSRGRARRKVAEFFAILQEDTMDTHLHAKSAQEETNMRSFNRAHLGALAAMARA